MNGFPDPTERTAPVISARTIDQSSPGTNDTLSVTVSSSDANGDAVTNRLPVAEKRRGHRRRHEATLNLATAGNGDAGDQISVRVTGHDGFSLSTPVTSLAVTIVNPNTAPTADVSLNDSAPRTNDAITATAVGSDGQNDPLTYTYVWKVEGVTRQTTSNVASTTDTFDLSPSNHGNRGEQRHRDRDRQRRFAHQHADRIEHRDRHRGEHAAGGRLGDDRPELAQHR